MAPQSQSVAGKERHDYAHLVKPGKHIRLKDFAPAETAGLQREEGEARSHALDAELSELQELLFAAGQHSLLLILQGLDTSGKDGTIKRVLRAVNPAGCRIVSFKAPQPYELARDFLWRVHAQVPERGQLGVFNRSHYEDVLIARVKHLVPPATWKARFEHINAFERLLVDNQTIVIKCFLYISKEEQEERLLAREEDVTKAWKLSAADWVERRAWDDYITAYEDVLSHCNAPAAPWYIVPADKKWFRNLAVGQLLVDQLRPYKAGWLAHLHEVGQRELQAIQATRQPRG